MVYPKFIRDFCALIPGVHRTIETSGHVPEKNFEQLFDIIDLFLFDFKATDPAKHKKWCGADNTLILSNLNFLLVNHKAIILRLPMIQGINDDTEHLDGIAELLHTYPDIRRTEIMPYHSYGAGKAETLGLPVNPELPAEGASRETSAAWLEALQKRGCTNVYLS
jgi:pyruvate formate lyase activating enzyme